MNSEWTSSTFAELMDQGMLEIGDGYRAKNDELGGDGLMFLRAGHIKDTHIDFAGVDRFRSADESKFGRKVVRGGDVIITTKGNSTGRVAFVTKAMPRFVYSPHVSYWRSMSGEGVEQGFLRAWSRSQEFLTQLSALSRSTDMAPYLSLSDQRRLRITLPPIASQRAIAELNDALYARLNLLRETNATLEAIAQALFKSWFVDFDPVRAKQHGIAPAGMDEATAALFPESFEESALGLVPAAWRVGSILDVASLLSGGTPKTDRADYWGGEIAWASAKDVSQSKDSVLISTERTITRQGLEHSATRLIPSMATVVVARGATTGRMALLGNAMAMNQTCYALTSKINTPVALYCLLRREVDVLVNAAHGSVFDTITTSTFARSKVVYPAQDVLDRFEEITGPIFQRIVVATEAANTLATLRDTLLPRLISGQLRLPQAEALAG